jgi:xanthine dehydrogenase iron-sulfur cluster and FAD-binding subunit A
MAGTPNGAAVGQALSGQAALHATVSAAMNAAAVAGNPLLAPGASNSTRTFCCLCMVPRQRMQE